MNRFLRWAENRYVIWTLYGIFAALFLYYAYAIGSDIFNPHFSEFREGHTFSSTHLLVKGVRPFTLETYPEYYNSYGILFNLVVTPFALLFGNTLILHRIINELFLIGTLAFLATYRTQMRVTFAHLIVIVWAWVLLNLCPNDSVRPDGLGIFLYSLSIFIPLRRGFDRQGMLVAMLCAILAFYTKVYFIGGWYLLSVALLFHSRVKFFAYNICFHAVLAISAAGVFRVFPLYFYETVFAYNTSVCNTDGGMVSSLLYSAKQYCRFVVAALPLLILIFIPFQKDLFKDNRLLVFLMIPCAVILFYPLGTNNGAYMTYHSHLLAPLLTALALASVEKTHHHVILWGAVMGAGLHLAAMCFSPMLLRHEDASKWEKIEHYVTESNNILNSDCLSYLLMKQNKELVTDGVSGFVYGYHPSPVTQYLFGLDDLLLVKKMQYMDRIRRGINEKKFDLIILSSIDGILPHFPDVDMDGYQLIEKIDIKEKGMPPMKFSVYKPR